MSNDNNIFDFANETLAQFLARAVDDGSYTDVFATTKEDKEGKEASATKTQEAAGRLWANAIDDYLLASYDVVRAVVIGEGVPDASTATKGKVLLAASGSTSATEVVTGSDARLLPPSVTFSAQDADLSSNTPATITKVGSTNVLTYIDGVLRDADFLVNVPKTYAGAGIKARLIWSGDTGSAAGLHWSIQVIKITASSNLVSGLGTFSVTNLGEKPGPANANDVLITDANITHTNLAAPAVGDLLKVRVRRFGNNDAYTGVGYLVALQLTWG